MRYPFCFLVKFNGLLRVNILKFFIMLTSNCFLKNIYKYKEDREKIK
jgi:hypothetical protein